MENQNLRLINQKQTKEMKTVQSKLQGKCASLLKTSQYMAYFFLFPINLCIHLTEIFCENTKISVSMNWH